MRQLEQSVNYPTITQPTRIEWRRDATLAPDLRPMFNAAVASLASFAAFMSAALATEASGRMVWVYMAACVGALTFLFYFTGLLWAQAQLGIREYTSETPVVPETGRAMRIMAADPANPRNYTVAKYALSEGQMRRLATALQREGWVMKRDAIRAARVLPTADMEQWRDVVLAEFERAGIIDATAAVTGRGRELFEPYVTPAPARFEATYNPPPVRRQSDGAARETWRGGVGGEE
jgi:hypothetical protein